MEFVIQPLELSQNSIELSGIDDNFGCVHNHVAQCGCIHNTTQGCACPKT